ncbi:MAG: arginine deiminase-related protein [Actinomycetota bacterium]|nr:arginine deiminase-related protein [Actinomycetota bacterium]
MDTARGAAVRLDWGIRYLMCPPRHFRVSYSINPWMDRRVAVDRDRALGQWAALVDALTAAGATVETLPPQPDLPDMVFAANAGLVGGRTFVPARMKHRQRRGEAAHAAAWFAGRGFDVTSLPPRVVQEGAGDALPFGRVLVAGYRTRSSASAYPALTARTGWPVRAVALSDPRYYHLDLTFCPLDQRRAMVVPSALDADGVATLRELVPEPLVLDEAEAATFCANSVVVGRTIVMPACPPRIGRQLERWGFDVAVVDVGEFLKAGGACRCLTLALDVQVPAARREAEARPAPPVHPSPGPALGAA